MSIEPNFAQDMDLENVPQAWQEKEGGAGAVVGRDSSSLC